MFLLKVYCSCFKTISRKHFWGDTNKIAFLAISLQEEVPMDMNKAQIICKETGLQRREEWSRIELVYGMPGKF